jgi:hypothetical protein
MISIADVSGMPVALVLTRKKTVFVDDPSAQRLLVEAIETRDAFRIAVSASAAS